jgi:hypothetical protein
MNRSILRVISPFYNVTLVSNKNRQYFCNHGYTMILLKYAKVGVKHQSVNQSINLIIVESHFINFYNTEFNMSN